MNDENPPETTSDTPTLNAPTLHDPDKPSHTHTRTGKIARLPKTVRDQINQMMLDGVPFAKIIENTILRRL
jgi:hypothetical protein